MTIVNLLTLHDIIGYVMLVRVVCKLCDSPIRCMNKRICYPLEVMVFRLNTCGLSVLKVIFKPNAFALDIQA